MLSTSYIAHYNAPKFFVELKNSTMSRFNKVVGGAFGASIIFFIFTMCTGFLTFGGSTAGFILNNYSGRDALATLARFSIGLALLTGYPFTFSALREGLMDLMKLTGNSRDNAFAPITASLLGLVTLLALMLKNVGFVVSISGAMFGCLLMFIVPAIMNIVSFRKSTVPAGSVRKAEIALNYAMIPIGVIMTVLGVYVSVLQQMGRM
jgi:amino acid permease